MTTSAPAEGGLSLSNARRGGRQILAAHGRIDHDTAQHLVWAVPCASADEPVALDLCAAEVADGPGTVLLLSTMRRLHARQRELIVVCPQPSLRRALDEPASPGASSCSATASASTTCRRCSTTIRQRPIRETTKPPD